MSALTDKNAILQVIGCLIKAPVLLADSKYIITKKDFDVPLANMIFQVINNLFSNYRMNEISIVDIDNYLQQMEGAYDSFKKQNGIQYLNDCIELSNLNSFDFYYNRMKKFSALRALKKDGFNIRNFYDEEELNVVKQEKQIQKLDEMSIEDIFDYYLKDINDLQCDYICKDDTEQGRISDGVEKLLNELEQNPEIGIPLQGKIYNTLTRGARLKKFYLISGASGTGKTRQMVGHACVIAYPERYNTKLKKWTKVGEGQRILFFATEMEKEEIQTMILAHLSAVNEDKILNNKYENPEEKQRVRDAIKVLEKYQDNFIFVRVGDPSIAQIKTLIRQQVLEYDIQYVFYDYIFSSPGLLKEYRDLNLREDVILMMASIALKDLANELEIFVMSGTQLNEKWKEYKGIRDYNLIRGSKAIADKIDVGGISLPLTQEEHDNVDQIARKLNLDLPTQVQDMYKIRRGKYNRVRIWSRVDLGTCRTEDLFLTDQNFNYIPITTNKYIFEDEMGSIINQEKMEEERKELKENMEDKKEKVLSFDDLL